MAKKKRRKKKEERPRITIAFGNKRQVLESIRRDEETEYPDANVRLDGRPGEWKVRRDVLPTDDLAQHRALDFRRHI